MAVQHYNIRCRDEHITCKNKNYRASVGMTARRTVTVSITPEQDALLRAFLHSGRYRSVSEVMRAALRQLEREEAATLTLIATSALPREADRA